MSHNLHREKSVLTDLDNIYKLLINPSGELDSEVASPPPDSSQSRLVRNVLNRRSN